MTETNVISLAEIKERAKGTIVQIPDWEPKKHISVRIKAIDMTKHIMKLDKLPNTLKGSANAVFNGETGSDKAIDDLTNDIGADAIADMLPIIEGVAKEALLEPTYSEIEEIYPLTLVQKMELFKIAMGGMQELESFRK